MRASARLLFAIAFIGGMDNAALAGSRASLADLLGQGYEVKATSTLSLTNSKALNEANITPTVLVTLQKGPSIAVCTFGAPFWELIGTAKDDPLHTPERYRDIIAHIWEARGKGKSPGPPRLPPISSPPALQGPVWRTSVSAYITGKPRLCED